MDRYNRTKIQRLITLFVLGCLLFNYPLIAIFNKNELLFGVPVLYIYIFLSWSILILLTALVIERSK